MKKLMPAVLMLLVMFMTRCTAAADVTSLVKQLASEKESERAAAVAELRKLGEGAQDALVKAELEKMEPQQLAIVRRLVGQLLVDKSELKPIDPALLTPFGEDKEKGT